MYHIFVIGSKGIPAKYGGYETFVENLTSKRKNQEIEYHVSCLSDNNDHFEHNDAQCFNVKVPNIGPAKAIYYDFFSFKKCLKYIKENHIEKSIIYVLTCRIGPLFHGLVKKAHKLGAKVLLNPDGHEWLRAKWAKPVRMYWKLSEKLMVKESDLIICDSLNIEKYIKEMYAKYNPNTTYIAYGADVKSDSSEEDKKNVETWYNKFDIKPFNYYLVVGRFVPENNFEIMLREFIKSDTKKDFVLITNVEENAFYKSLDEKYHFTKDPRVKFVGTVYDAKVLHIIREQAYAYLHGHSVGGTNPSLLEALAATKLNLLFDVGFNKECGQDSAIYFTGEEGNLKALIESSDKLTQEQIDEYGVKSTNEILNRYSWSFIIDEYEKTFLGEF